MNAKLLLSLWRLYRPTALTISLKSECQRHRQRVKKVSFEASMNPGTVQKSMRKSTNEGVMQELADDAIQCEHTLLNLLKSKYPFREETNQNILYDYEIRRLADFYNITDFILFWHVMI
ncbi:unnamed protein product [Rhizophagus irregularis]|nr:unnamed protein product [Rhizophagus irregularis]